MITGNPVGVTGTDFAIQKMTTNAGSFDIVLGASDTAGGALGTVKVDYVVIT